MNKTLDTLLNSDLLSVPDNFTDQVMKEIYQLPMPTPRQTWKKRLQWLAIFSSAALGTVELFSFIFGIWIATAAY
ncbi:MAG: hypothetical protein KAH20_12515 [Methylococcales bacterium]|nr:hypothetical protein [Methylococcales bacterium]